MGRHQRVILIGIILGVVLGAVAGGLSPRFGREVKFVGDIFLHALMMMVVPLVISSMITGVAGLGDVRRVGGIGARTITYYMVTTLVSVITGLMLVNIINPGKGLSAEERLYEAPWRIEANVLELEGGVAFTRPYVNDRYELAVGITEESAEPIAIGLFSKRTEPDGGRIEVEEWVTPRGEPSSPPSSGTGVSIRLRMSESVRSKQDTTIIEVLKNVLISLVPVNLFEAMVNMDILPLIIFSLVFGAVLTTMGDKGKAALDFFATVNDAILNMVRLLMIVMPVGIFAMIAGRLGEAGGWSQFFPELLQLGKYALTVVSGLLVHAIVTLPLILWFFTRRNPLSYLSAMATALTTAFSTASSSATLPMTLKSVEDAGVQKRTGSFVIPLGATINMDGTALYEAVAVMFIAQVYGIEMNFGHQTIIFLTATLAAIGAAGIPEAGLVTMVIVLKAVDLPIEGISLLLVIDWFLDRCRTTVNVWGDAIGAAVIDQLERPILGEEEPRAT